MNRDKFERLSQAEAIEFLESAEGRQWIKEGAAFHRRKVITMRPTKDGSIDILFAGKMTYSERDYVKVERV